MILIVDDEILGGDSLREALEDEGYRVTIARNGLEAMQQLETAPPSLMILDLLMPGMHGNALYDEMQKSPRLAKIPVLVTTSDPTWRPRCASSRARGRPGSRGRPRCHRAQA